jgi:hypothetical protein
MAPSYRDGDYVLTMRYGRRRPRVGDDVVFMHPDFGRLLKRVERIQDGFMSFTGTNALSADSAALGAVSLSSCSSVARVALRFPLG